jgi:chromosome segregation ATPase
VQAVQADMDSLAAEQEDAAAKVTEQNSEIERLTERKDTEMGPEFKRMETQVTSLSKDMVSWAVARLHLHLADSRVRGSMAMAGEGNLCVAEQEGNP